MTLSLADSYWFSRSVYVAYSDRASTEAYRRICIPAAACQQHHTQSCCFRSRWRPVGMTVYRHAVLAFTASKLRLKDIMDVLYKPEMTVWRCLWLAFRVVDSLRDVTCHEGWIISRMFYIRLVLRLADTCSAAHYSYFSSLYACVPLHK